MRTFQTTFLTLIACWLALSSQAQGITQVDTLPDPFGLIRDPFRTLDTLQMPTGYLLDAAWQMGDIRPHQGIDIPHDSLAVSFGDYQDLYITAFSMSMTEPARQRMLTLRHMEAGDCENGCARDTARLHGIALAYDRLDPRAFSDGLLRADSLARHYYDVPGRTRSPYQPDHAHHLHHRRRPHRYAFAKLHL